ncbi:hypothetical protein EOA78_00975 [Mesorhizobium sp. M5C.F.Cr.IN.023.01.1.1]|nr:hypothetical protein EOA78_00975 [Mesorhizobium sp. M5C.F.Cr.IN.023.01.1.1]
MKRLCLFPVGVLLLGQNDEWAVQRARCITLETIRLMSDHPLHSCRRARRPKPSPTPRRWARSRAGERVDGIDPKETSQPQSRSRDVTGEGRGSHRPPLFFS